MALNYFFFFGAIGAFWPFLGPHLHALGLSGRQVGVLTAVQPVAVALLAPLIGAYADRHALHRRVLRLLIVPSVISIVLLSQATQFVPVLLLFIAWSASVAGLMPILDSYAMTLSESEKVPYGRLRMFGTLGYLVAVMLVGRISEQLPPGGFFLIYAGLLTVVALVAGGLPASQNRSQAAGPPLQFDLRAVLGHPALAALLLVCFDRCWVEHGGQLLWHLCHPDPGGDHRAAGHRQRHAGNL